MSVSLPSGRLEKTTRSSPHHVAQLPEAADLEDDVGVWRYAILSCMPETTTTISGI